MWSVKDATSVSPYNWSKNSPNELTLQKELHNFIIINNATPRFVVKSNNQQYFND